MASITSAGIGSGLDIAGLVSQLVAAEGQPAERRIARGEAVAQSRLSAYGSLKSALSQLRDQLAGMKNLDSLLAREGSSSNEDLFGVSVADGAVPASYSIEVLQLATAQKLTSGAFASADTVVGTGDLRIDVGGTAFTISIDNSNNTLSGIRNAINAAGDNSGVAASIVNAGSGSYLVLSGRNTGAAQTITVTQSGGDGGLAALEYDPGNGLNAMTETNAAQDARIRVDGLDVTSATNSVVGAIDGVTIELVAASVGNPATLTVQNDTAAVKRTIKAFVDSYNELVKTFSKLSAFDADKKTAGPLLGDASLRSVRDQLRRELSVGIGELGATFNSLGEIGIQLEVDGKMKIVDEDLDAAFAENFNGVGQLFAGENGFATRLFDLAEGFLKSDGVITTRSEGLGRTIEGFAEQRRRLGERLDALETRLLRQFNALDALVGRLTSTSNFLTQQLANLPTPGKSRNG